LEVGESGVDGGVELVQSPPYLRPQIVDRPLQLRLQLLKSVTSLAGFLVLVLHRCPPLVGKLLHRLQLRPPDKAGFIGRSGRGGGSLRLMHELIQTDAEEERTGDEERRGHEGYTGAEMVVGPTRPERTHDAGDATECLLDSHVEPRLVSLDDPRE